MPKRVVAYQCEHCAMTSLRRSNVTRHEQKSCRENPNRRSCHTCEHSCKARVESDYPFESLSVEGFVCGAESAYFDGERIDNCPDYERKESTR
jgi:hypothetical protein